LNAKTQERQFQWRKIGTSSPEAEENFGLEKRKDERKLDCTELLG
jgi:hypothetical protein